ncbi:MAG: Gldg family protein [Aggregatilineales bacterium]
MTDDSITLTRGRLAQLASLIGGAGILAGILGLIAGSVPSPLAISTLVVGIAGIIGWALLAPPDFIGFITGQRVRYGTITIFSTLLLIGIVGLTYTLLARGAVTLDMTENRRFTLSPESMGVLRRVNREIMLTGFYTSRALRTREVDDQFFRLYETATDGLVLRQYIDPEEQPAMAQRFGVYEDAQVFISFLNPDGSVDFSTLARVPRGPNQERDVTEAISRLLIAGTIKVYFEVGNSTRSPLDASQEGISGINNGIRESGLITAPLNLSEIAAAGMDIPEDAAAVIFARPLRDLSTAEIDVLARYLEDGGGLLLMTDILFTDDAFLQENGAFNQFLWENFGIRALDAVIVDPVSSGQTALDVISTAAFTDNAVGRRLIPEESLPTIFRVVRAVDVDLERSLPNVTNGRVLMSSPASYGETNLRLLGDTNTYRYDPGEDLPGPLTMAVWSWNLANDARILLIGDSDFASNGMIMMGSNSILFTDGLSWVSGFGDRINFAPQAYTTGLPLLFISQQQLDLITFFVVILLPGSLLVLGLAIWARRVRRT